MRSNGHRSFFVLLLVCIAALSGCGGDDGGNGSPNGPDNAQVPQELQGVWEQTVERVACDAAAVGLLREAVTETIQICPSLFVEDPGAFDDIPCDFTWSDGDTRLDIDCGGTLTVEDCTTDFSLVGTVTYLSATEVEFEYRNEVRSTGTCDFPLDECTVETGTMTRLSTSIDDCEVPDTGGGEGMSLTITGGGNPGVVDFSVATAVDFGGIGYSISASTQPNFTTFRNLTITLPADSAVGSAAALTHDQSPELNYSEARASVLWSMNGFEGTITLSRLDDAGVAGTFGGTALLVNSATQASETVSFDGSFDVPFTDPGFRPSSVASTLGALIERAHQER